MNDISNKILLTTKEVAKQLHTSSNVITDSDDFDFFKLQQEKDLIQKKLDEYRDKRIKELEQKIEEQTLSTQNFIPQKENLSKNLYSLRLDESDRNKIAATFQQAGGFSFTEGVRLAGLFVSELYKQNKITITKDGIKLK